MFGVKAYVPVTFAFLGFGAYVATGGRDFRPEERDVAVMELSAPAELVTRAETEPTLATVTDLPLIAPLSQPEAQVSTVALTPDPETPAIAEVEVGLATSVADALAGAPAPRAVAPAETAEPAVAASDLRFVDSDRVNMREGPGKDFGVIDQLLQGTEVEILETAADGWVRLRVITTGAEGWMAERLLSPPTT